MSNGTRIRHQTSETFLVSAILSFSGGLQDAYTYYSRDKVFANAQTGNVVIMSKLFMTGNFKEALQYLSPLLAFAIGIVITEHIGHIAHSKYRSNIKIHWRQVVLFLEAIILFSVGFIPSEYNMLASSLVSLSCAMQVEAFKTVHGFGYASTMCIGNLRCAMESLTMNVRDKDKEAGVRMYYYYGVIFTFAIGAGVGGILSDVMDLKAIWICCLLLLICCIIMIKKHSVMKSPNNKYLYTLTHMNIKNKKDKAKSDKSSSKVMTEVSSSQNVYVDIDIETGMPTTQTNSLRNVVVEEYDDNNFIPMEEEVHIDMNDDINKKNADQADITKLDDEIIIVDGYDDMDTDINTEVNGKNFLKLEDNPQDIDFDIDIDRDKKDDKDGASLSTNHQTIVAGDNVSQVDNSFRIVNPIQIENSKLEHSYSLRIDPTFQKNNLKMDNIIIDNISPKDTIKVEDLLINDTQTNKLDLMNSSKLDDTLRNDSVN